LTSAARSATAAEAGTVDLKCRCENPHGQEAQKQAGISDLRPAQGYLGSDERADQGDQCAETLPVAGPGEDQNEWHLFTDTHNLLKLFRYRRSLQLALVGATG